MTVTVNGHGDPVNYGQGDTLDTIATNLANAINNDSGAYATATPSGGMISLTAKQTGPGSDYSLSTSVTYDSTDFSSPSFTATPSGSSLTGGSDGGGPCRRGRTRTTLSGACFR